MTAYLNRNWDYLLSLGNASFTLASISAVPWDKLLTVLFVTLPVGVWSWFRLIDYLRNRYARKNDNPSTDSPDAL